MAIETHTHLSHPLFDGMVPCVDSEENSEERVVNLSREELVEKIKEKVRFCIEPAIGYDSIERVEALCEKYNNFIYPAYAVHPKFIETAKVKNLGKIIGYIKSDNCVAIGETGLDYSFQGNQHRVKQKIWLVIFLMAGHKYNKPFVFHFREPDAIKDGIKILRVFNKLAGDFQGVIHCFNGSTEDAIIFTEELGLYLGIGGKIHHENVAEAIKAVDIKHIITETDSPYVRPPKPENISKKSWTKKARNTPLIIPDIIRKIAEIKGIMPTDVDEITTENARKLFNI